MFASYSWLVAPCEYAFLEATFMTLSFGGRLANPSTRLLVNVILLSNYSFSLYKFSNAALILLYSSL